MKFSTEIGSFGINVNHEVMNNGELRFRLNSSDGSAYIRTESGEIGAWQNSHFHLTLEETYIIQKGWICIAELIEGELKLVVQNESDIYTVNSKVVHNIYLPKNTIIHTVKHGNSRTNDWHKCEALDDLTVHLSELDIEKLVKKKQII